MARNIEKTIIAFLKEKLPADWPVHGSIPENKPEKFVTAERTGGDVDNVRIEHPEIIISFYHQKSAVQASDMALEIDEQIRFKLPELPGVSQVRRNSLVRLDDTIIKYNRYQAYYTFVHLL